MIGCDLVEDGKVWAKKYSICKDNSSKESGVDWKTIISRQRNIGYVCTTAAENRWYGRKRKTFWFKRMYCLSRASNDANF